MRAQAYPLTLRWFAVLIYTYSQSKMHLCANVRTISAHASRKPAPYCSPLGRATLHLVPSFKTTLSYYKHSFILMHAYELINHKNTSFKRMRSDMKWGDGFLVLTTTCFTLCHDAYICHERKDWDFLARRVELSSARFMIKRPHGMTKYLVIFEASRINVEIESNSPRPKLSSPFLTFRWHIHPPLQSLASDL